MTGKKPKFTAKEIGTVLFALTKINCEPEVGAGILLKMYQHSVHRSRGRPKVRKGAGLDERRARWVEHHKEEFPDMTDRDAVEHALFMVGFPNLIQGNPEFESWFSDDVLETLKDNRLETEASKIFPTSLTHEDGESSWTTILQSISRGRKKLRAPD